MAVIEGPRGTCPWCGSPALEVLMDAGTQLPLSTPRCRSCGAQELAPYETGPGSTWTTAERDRGWSRTRGGIPTYKDIARRFWEAHGAWSDETFGPPDERGPLGPIKHLQKEAGEVEDAYRLLRRLRSVPPSTQAFPEAEASFHVEVVDCLLLVFDIARRAGLTYEQLFLLAFDKLQVNAGRSWPTMPPDEAVEHAREDALHRSYHVTDEDAAVQWGRGSLTLPGSKDVAVATAPDWGTTRDVNFTPALDDPDYPGEDPSERGSGS